MSEHERASMPELRAVLAAEQAGLDAARLEGNRVAEAHRALAMADLFYRLGDARTSFDTFVLAMQLGAGEDSLDDDLALEVEVARAARRASLFDEALAGFGRALEHPLAESPASRALILAERALVYAAQGDATRADADLHGADATARAADDPDAMTRVWRSVGEASLLLQRPADAATAFVRALEIAQDTGAPTGVASSVAPAEVFATLVGMHAAGGAGDEVLLGALALAPEALREADAWWELPRLCAGFLRLAAQGYLGEPSLFWPARLLSQAALQREDCAAHAGGLRLIAT